MTEGGDFWKKRKCKNIQCSSMLNSAWCDLNSKGDILELHDKCPNPKCKCQKLITFTPRQFMLEGNGFKFTMKKIVKGSQTAWKKILKPAINATAPFRGMTVSAKTKNRNVGQATTNILNSLSGGEILSLPDLHGNGLRLKVM